MTRCSGCDKYGVMRNTLNMDLYSLRICFTRRLLLLRDVPSKTQEHMSLTLVVIYAAFVKFYRMAIYCLSKL